MWFPHGFWQWFFSLPWPFFATTIVAVLAVWMAHRQATSANEQLEETRKHNRLSVKPLLKLQFVSLGPPIEEVGLNLQNKGVGPAVITEVRFWKDYMPMDTPPNPAGWLAIVRELGIDCESCAGWTPGKENVMAPGDLQQMYAIKGFIREKDKGNVGEIMQAASLSLMRIGVTVTYESMYGEEQQKVSFYNMEVKPVPNP